MNGGCGKGDAPRQSTRPSWVGLQEIERAGGMVVFKTRTGRKIVPLAEVERYERTGR